MAFSTSLQRPHAHGSVPRATRSVGRWLKIAKDLFMGRGLCARTARLYLRVSICGAYGLRVAAYALRAYGRVAARYRPWRYAGGLWAQILASPTPSVTAISL